MTLGFFFASSAWETVAARLVQHSSARIINQRNRPGISAPSGLMESPREQFITQRRKGSQREGQSCAFDPGVKLNGVLPPDRYRCDLVAISASSSVLRRLRMAS